MSKRDVPNALGPVVPVLRKLRHMQGKQQKEVCKAAGIKLDRLRKLEGGVARYALKPAEARSWASALDGDLDELVLDASGFYDVMPRGRAYGLSTYVGCRGGEEVPLETSPVRLPRPDPDSEAAAWRGIESMDDLSEFNTRYSRPSSSAEIIGWVQRAKEHIAANPDDSPEGLEQLPVYADWLLELSDDLP